MNCNIIKDLMPSYIDGICSEETVSAIEKHIEHCTNCRTILEMMQQPTVQIVEPNIQAAKEPFKRINKKRRFQVMTAIVLSFIICIIGSLVVQDVGIVKQYFFPKFSGVVKIEDGIDEWHNISFSDFHFNEHDYLIYDSLFWKKEIVNDANSESDVLLRIKDEKGKLIIDEILIPPGKSVKLEELKRNKKYFIEIKAPKGGFININAV